METAYKVSVSAVSQLKQSNKGKLVYLRGCLNDPSHVKKYLDDWVAPARVTVTKSVRNGGDATRAWTEYRTTDENHTQDHSEVNQPPTVSNNSNDQSTISCNGDSIPTNTTLSPSTHRCIESPDYLTSRKQLAEVNNKWSRKAEAFLQEKRKQFKDHGDDLEKRIALQLRNLELFQVSQAERQSNEALAYHQQSLIDVEKRLEKMREEHYNRNLVVEGKFKEVEARKIQLQDKAKLAEQERQENRRKLADVKNILLTSTNKLLQSYDSCEFKQLLPPLCAQIHELMSRIHDKAEAIMKEAESGSGGDVYMKKMRVLYDQFLHAADVLNNHIEEANTQGNQAKAEKEKQELEEQNKKDQLSQVKSAFVAAQQEGSLDLCVDLQAYTEYAHLMKRLKEMEETIEPFIKDSQQSKLRFSLQKAINIPLNAISSVSGRHIRDKLQRIRTLLNGQRVELGTKSVSVKDHPLALDFCKNLLAKMIVKKADEQVTSKHETAFPIAMVTVGICGEFPDIRELLLAHFYRVCPYLVPYYISKEEGMSDEDYHRSRGYKYENGVVEKQDKFLKRMSGFMCLYSALMVSPAPPNYPHVFHIQNAWLWLTRILNIDPEPDVTATLLNDLLTVCGSTMFPMYKKQFSKLLHILLTEYMSKIESTIISGGPVSRLRGFLQECVTNGRIKEPDGLLRAHFWDT